jgi:protein-ribulosamine 3-kinase
MVDFYNEILQKHIHPSLEVLEIKPMGGGCINNAQRVNTIKGDFFIKSNINAPKDFFEKEAKCLELLAKQEIITIPKVLGSGIISDTPYLLLEYINSGKRKENFWTDFGTKLARLHKVSQQNFGLDFDNYIGLLPQHNGFEKDWLTFFWEKRIKAQIEIGKSKKLITKEIEIKFDKLYEKLPELLVIEKPSLIHGDLWGGNVMVDTKGEICLMDPSSCFSHREMEIAATHLFGGFEKEFYNAYFQEFPVAKEIEKRIEVYNLYPLLVHTNLFGGTYMNAVNGILKRYTN